MGQTLTHGVYLPDEGERNCYNGLAANWSILDNSVGTIAEHTSALSGKAPLVHTHTKSDITDFPAYGNTADTICEGNDSRLSDARTPVAHTHTKSDVTDLFNSANVWSDNQNFRKTLIIQNSVAVSAGSYDIGINFFDSAGNRYGYIQPYVTTGNQKRLMLGSDTGELSCNSDFIPANNNLNFGNSTLKWKTLNGVNPGALSLPSSHYVEIGTDGWDLSGATYNRVYINNANPTFPGILFIRINSTTLPSIIVRLFSTSGTEITYSGNKIDAANNNMIITVPCPPSTNIYVSINTSSSIYSCRYYTLLGDPKFDSRSGS